MGKLVIVKNTSPENRAALRMLQARRPSRPNRQRTTRKSASKTPGRVSLKKAVAFPFSNTLARSRAIRAKEAAKETAKHAKARRDAFFKIMALSTLTPHMRPGNVVGGKKYAGGSNENMTWARLLQSNANAQKKLRSRLLNAKGAILKPSGKSVAYPYVHRATGTPYNTDAWRQGGRLARRA